MRVIRFLALAGLAISVYLIIMKLTGRISSVVGCGGEGGCTDVLGSQWSQWFGIPVSVASAGFYLVIFGLSFRPSSTALALSAVLLIAAAAWFMGLQIFVIEAFCPWCLATHLVGITLAGFLIWKTRLKVKPILFLIPLTLIFILAAGQIYGPKPQTYEITNEVAFEEEKEESLREQDSPDLVEEKVTLPADQSSRSPGGGRLVEFKGPNGRVVKSFRLGQVPLMGSPEAPHIIVKYFDYTCGSCRDMEGDLSVLLTAYSEEVAVILLPTPLNKACNPFMKEGVPNHKNACELARLGLAAWRAKPEVFEQVHELLFERPIHTPESARKAIAELIEPADLEQALQDPWVNELLQKNFNDYRALSSQNVRMPKLLMKGGRTMHGLAPSAEKLVELVVKTQGIR